MKSRILLSVIFIVGSLTYSQSFSPPAHAPEVAQVPSDIAGRSGAFHFFTDEEMRAKRVELSELRASIERVRASVDRLAARDPELRRQVHSELDAWSSHLGREEQRLNVSVSQTAAVAERRLTEMKGTRSCGTCHSGGPVTRSDF